MGYRQGWLHAIAMTCCLAATTSVAHAAPDACAALAHGIEELAGKHLGSLVKGLAFDVTKNILGVKLRAAAKPPKLGVKATHKGQEISVTLTLEPGTLEGSVDAGLFGKDSATVTFPKTALQTSVRFPCASTCGDFKKLLVNQQPVVKFLVGKVNEELLAKLPDPLSVGGLKVGMKWPRVELSPSSHKDHLFTATLSSWGPLWGSYKSMKLSFDSRAQLKKRSLEVPCPLVQKEAPKPPVEPPYHDNVLTCDSNLAYKVHFGSGSAEIAPGYRQNASQLAALTAALATGPTAGCRMEILGHTDCQGSDASNQKLSTSRANALMAYLKGKSGLPTTSSGKSFGQPYCSLYPPAPSTPMNKECPGLNATTDCLTQNRRVDLHWIKTQK